MVCIVLVVASGVVYGLQTNRWTVDNSLHEAAARLDRVPKVIGDWQSREVEIPESHLRVAGAVGHISRVYKNSRGQQVQVMLLCGKHGPISLHPPTVCFASAGWSLASEPQRRPVTEDNGSHLGEFWIGHFRKRLPDGVAHMKTYWAWKSTEKWNAPDRPRMAYAGASYVYKLYVTTLVPAKEDSRGDVDACVAFMRELGPVLSRVGI